MRKITPALFATLFVGSSLAVAATPNLGAIRPTGAQRGTEVEVTLSGARLGDAQEILFYQPGITTVSLTKVDDNNVKAKLQIAADAPLGLHDLRLRTATGVSEHRTFSVGAMKDVAEAEPNNEFAKPQPIPMNSVVNGVADNEDVDYFVVDAKKGDRITAEVEGIRLGITMFDPFVAIMDMKRFELASSDDAALIWQDGVASVLAPEDGKYIVQVRESAYAGNGACLYRLHVGNFPVRQRPSPRAARSARAFRSPGSATLRERRSRTSPFLPRPIRTSASSPRTPPGPPPIRTPSGFPRSATSSRPSRTATTRRPLRSPPRWRSTA